MSTRRTETLRKQKRNHEERMVKAFFYALFFMVIVCSIAAVAVIIKVAHDTKNTEIVPESSVQKQTKTRTEVIEREQETVTITEVTESVTITNVDYAIREITEQELQDILDTSKVVYFDVPLSKEEQDYCYYCSELFNVPVTLIIATIDKESEFNPNARSASNDSGYMQVNDCNLKTLKDKFQITDIFDPYQNILGGTYLLSENLKAAGGDINPGMMAYNMGLANAKKHWKNGTYSSAYSREVYSLYLMYEEQMNEG